MNKVTPLHERIKTRRKELKLSQQQLADAVKVSHVTIFKWENGDVEPNGKNLFQLARALRCSPTWVLYGDDDKLPQPANELNDELDERQLKLLELFEFLPESEKERCITDLEAKVDELNTLFEELLKVRKKQK